MISGIPAGAPGSKGTVQATIEHLDPGSGPLHDFLLVRGNRDYLVNITCTAGSTPYFDLTTYVYDLPSTYVPLCTKVPVGITLPACDLGSGFPNTGGCGSIKGNVDMLTESEFFLPGTSLDPYFGRTVMKASGGPNGNYRWSRVPDLIGGGPGSGPISSGAFCLPNVVPSDTTHQYQVQGFMNFGTDFNFEYFATPVHHPVAVQCSPATDLFDMFVMYPGVVKSSPGQMILRGPGTVPWALSSLVRYDQFESSGPLSGAPKGSLYNNDYDLLGSSYIQATGGISAEGGVGRVQFDGSVSLNGGGLSQFSGTYNLRLAALDSGSTLGSSQWSPNLLHLRFLDISSDPERHLDSVVEITEPTFINQTIDPNVPVIHNPNICFGELVVSLINTFPGVPFTAPKISGTGTGHYPHPVTSVPVPYTVSVSAEGLPTSSGNVDGVIRLFVPEGIYTFQTSVQYAHGRASQPPFDSEVEVGCGGIGHVTLGGPKVHIDGVTPCAPPIVTGSVTGPNAITTIECWVDNAYCGPVALNSLPAFSFTLYSLTPGPHTILIKATDSLLYVASYSFPFVLMDVPAPCQVFNTGMEGPDGNVPVAAGYPDPNFKLISAPTGASPPAVVASPAPPSPWLPNDLSQWIGPVGNQVGPAGIYHYQLQFTSCCPADVRLVGRIASDDTASLVLNNNNVGSVPAPGFTTWTPVNLTSGFFPGVNLLDIYVTNSGGWTGLRAELTNCCVVAEKYVQWPDTSTNGLDVHGTAPKMLADDFLCLKTTAITNIQIWGSWFEDNPDPNVQYLLGIWSDVPVSPVPGISHPGQLLWSAWFGPGQYTAELYTNAQEHFYDPSIAGTEGLIGPETNIWWYSFNPTNPFCQAGTKDHPVVYWLSVLAVTSDSNHRFGWKTSTNHWNDDAVWGNTNSGHSAEMPVEDWQELRDPRRPNSLDLSFLLNDGPCEPPTPKYVQWPDESFTGLDVKAVLPKILADDFLCTNNAAISNIQIWGSWTNDIPAPYAHFQLGIWSDVPANPPNPSHPGQLLWSRTFTPFMSSEYTWDLYKNANEWFYDADLPDPISLMIPDTKIWRYSFTPPIPFCQQGTPTSPLVYWLSLSVDVPEPHFGWKTSTNHWNDTAVFGHISGGAPLGDWQELRDPRSQVGLDLSFLLNEGSCIPVPVVIDINEWLAINTLTLANTNNGGTYDGWFELHNPSDTAVDLQGYYLTDEPTNVYKFQIPAGFRIAPHGYLLVWSDNNPALNQSNSLDLHANFRLAGGGGAIGLFTAGGTNMDTVSFGPQTADVSRGRWPDGWTNCYFMTRPTPRLSNVLSEALQPPRLEGAVLLTNNSIQFTMTVVPGTQYQLQYKDNLSAPTWTPLGPPQTAPSPGVILTDSLVTATQRFYRVLILP